VLAVQWHAEGLTSHARHAALFRELVAAAASPARPLRRAA
jgi:gamma-glutamyl-gamma-aminobutyrate hydrolase PuuD